jgi:chromosome segregation ATPase
MSQTEDPELLEKEKQEKQQNYDKLVQETAMVQKRLDMLQSLANELGRGHARISKESEAQQEQARQSEEDQKQKHRRSLDALVASLHDKERPLQEAKSQYDLVSKRCRFYQEFTESSMQEIQCQISEFRYNQCLTRAKIAEVRERVEALKQFIQEKRPDIQVMEIAKELLARAEEKDALERSIAALKGEIEGLKQGKPE